MDLTFFASSYAIVLLTTLNRRRLPRSTHPNTDIPFSITDARNTQGILSRSTYGRGYVETMEFVVRATGEGGFETGKDGLETIQVVGTNAGGRAGR